MDIIRGSNGADPGQTKHFAERHDENIQMEFYFEFDWVILKIGGGQFEMNMMKSFTELNWVPLMEHLCITMGFNSNTAKASAKKCNNHHKAWVLILIFHMDTLLELVVEYVRDFLQQGVACSGKQFIYWARKKGQLSFFMPWSKSAGIPKQLKIFGWE